MKEIIGNWRKFVEEDKYVVTKSDVTMLGLYILEANDYLISESQLKVDIETLIALSKKNYINESVVKELSFLSEGAMSFIKQAVSKFGGNINKLISALKTQFTPTQATKMAIKAQLSKFVNAGVLVSIASQVFTPQIAKSGDIDEARMDYSELLYDVMHDDFMGELKDIHNKMQNEDSKEQMGEVIKVLERTRFVPVDGSDDPNYKKLAQDAAGTFKADFGAPTAIRRMKHSGGTHNTIYIDLDSALPDTKWSLSDDGEIQFDTRAADKLTSTIYHELMHAYDMAFEYAHGDAISDRTEIIDQIERIMGGINVENILDADNKQELKRRYLANGGVEGNFENSYDALFGQLYAHEGEHDHESGSVDKSAARELLAILLQVKAGDEGITKTEAGADEWSKMLVDTTDQAKKAFDNLTPYGLSAK